jgi:hypothetical protein
MSDSASHPGRFVVSAKRREGRIQQTRVLAASAIVLAQTWRAAGYVEVVVIDPTGKRVKPETYGAEVQRERERKR